VEDIEIFSQKRERSVARGRNLHRKDAKSAKKKEKKEKLIVLQKQHFSLLLFSFFASFASSRCKFFDHAPLSACFSEKATRS
jgi:hypothetical protein